MRMLTLNPDMLEVETFTTAPLRGIQPFRLAADTDDADCDTESGPPDCETAAPDCDTFDCSEPEMCGEVTEDC
ncbi:hypothetical protein [Longimicrobium sp.]|uniref:hypothetical protein n=1 Tax=Longimicrobium sp. TaxID=2029185 RepID=UPI002BEC853A|nr:hypothetical protein [Longimicrobium sp.]HSU16431.1 hypothetical protein [Longimicrobium sp.]